MADNFIIDPSDVSQVKIEEKIQAYLDSAPDEATWRDYFASSVGTIIKKLFSAHAAYLAFQNILARREAYLFYVTNRSSAVAIGQSRGYSAYRGSAGVITITVTPATDISLSKFDVVGSVKDQDLIILTDKELVAGIQTTIQCSIGEVGSESKSISGGQIQVFRFTNPNVSEYIKLSLNGDEVPISSFIVDAANETFVALSNSSGSVDVFYTNDESFTTRYETGDTLTLDYISLTNTSFIESDITFFYDTLNGISLDETYRAPEATDSIVVNAPLFNETKYVVRGRNDYEKIFKLLDIRLVDTGHLDISPMVVKLLYIKSDMSTYTQAEKDNFITTLAINRNMGLVPPVIGDPVRHRPTLRITVTPDGNSPNLSGLIDTALAQYELKLNQKITFADIEQDVEYLEGVKIARVSIETSEHQADFFYETGAYVSVATTPGSIYRANRILYRSGSSQPTWPTTLDDTIDDGRVVWKCKYLERQCDPINPLLPLIPPRDIWSSSTGYNVGDIVIPTSLDIYEYECIAVKNYSDAIEPTWPILDGESPEALSGQEIGDKHILWIALPQQGTPSAWQANTNYNLGDTILATDPSTSDTIGLMFQAVSFRGKTTDSPVPTFDDTEYELTEDNEIEWKAVNPTKDPEQLPKDAYYKLSKVLQIL